MIITIDGPAASGKSTVGFLLSCKLNFFYLNSGALFRAVAYIFLNNPNLTFQDIINNLEYVFFCDTNFKIYYKNEDITGHLQDAHVASLASIISVKQELRTALLILQQDIANNKNIVADGRDAGTIVFPNAEFKFFITATAQIRAARWRADQIKLGNIITQQAALDWINQRDFRDSNRKIAPLKPAQDAIIIDTSQLTLEEVINIILKKINKSSSSFAK